MKEQEVIFKHEEEEVKLTFTPTEEDFWITINGFDIHYSEEDNEICVYEEIPTSFTGTVIPCIHKQNI